MGTILSVLSILLSFLFWKYTPEDIERAFQQFYHSKFLKKTLTVLKYIFKIKVIGAFLFCSYYYYIIALLVWLKFELSINGAIIAFFTFTSLTIATVFYFKGAFQDLFFPKNNNNQKPFSIV